MRPQPVIGGGTRSPGWRKLLADASGTSVATPLEEESGCLGAAIQAYVCTNAAAGTPVSFEQSVKRFKASTIGDGIAPDPTLRSAYDRARGRYAEHLAAVYPKMVVLAVPNIASRIEIPRLRCKDRGGERRECPRKRF